MTLQINTTDKLPRPNKTFWIIFIVVAALLIFGTCEHYKLARLSNQIDTKAKTDELKDNGAQLDENKAKAAVLDTTFDDKGNEHVKKAAKIVSGVHVKRDEWYLKSSDTLDAAAQIVNYELNQK